MTDSEPQKKVSSLTVGMTTAALSAKTIEHNTLFQFIKYLITGVTAFVIEWLIYFVLVELLKTNYIKASVIVYFFTFWFGFLVNRFWSFKSKGNIGKQLVNYILLFVFNLVIGHISILYAFTDILGLNPLIAKPLVMVIIVPWNFVVYKKIIYKT